MSSSASKRLKERDSRKHSRSESFDRKAPKEKRRRHHKDKHHKDRHYKDRKREKEVSFDYNSDDSDVIEVIPSDSHVTTPPPPHINKSDSIENNDRSADSLSIEETNKLRAKLGLKPLQIADKNAKSEDGKKKDDLGEFYHKPAHNLSQKIRQEKVRSRLAEHKEKRGIDSKLSKVKLLTEVDSEDDDASAWINKSRHIETSKKEAAKRAKVLEELDAQFGIGEIIEAEKQMLKKKVYSEKNLKGLQVDHNVKSFREGETVILTLKDRAVLDATEDVLVNVNIRDNEVYEKSNENKKKKSFYSDGFNDEEGLDTLMDTSHGILNKYNEEIEGEQIEGFKIGIKSTAKPKQTYRETVKNKLFDTLATSSLSIASDYYNEEELAKFKKPKKKLRKMRKGKILTADDLATSSAIDVKHGKFKHDINDFDDNPAPDIKIELKLEDEQDEMQRLLALHKKQSKKKPVSHVRSTKHVASAEELMDSGNIILNSTAEFCRTLGDIPTYGKSGNREDSENLLDLEKDYMEKELTDEEEDVDEGGKWNQVDLNRVVKEPIVAASVVEVPILDEEPDVGSGVGAALKLAMSKGYLDKEDSGRPSNSRLAHLQAQHYSIEDKSYGEEQERGNRRERYLGPIMDFKEKDMFKPNVKLEYIDDEGHILNAKEAFRYLSHKFHGKGPGKNKVEKRLKKSQQEGLMKKMSSTDTPLGTLNMLQSKQKEMQSPYIVLSGGKHTHSTTIAKARR